MSQPSTQPPSPSIYPGLDEAATACERALSLAAGTPVKVTVASVSTLTARELSKHQPLTVAATHDRVLTISADLAGPLSEAVMGLPPRPHTITTLTPATVRALSGHIAPALAPIATVIEPSLPPLTLTHETGLNAWAPLNGTLVLAATLTLTLADVTGTLTLVTPVAAPGGGSTNPTALAALAPVPVTATVTLPPVKLSARALRQLHPGSTVNLTLPLETLWLLRVPGALLATGNLGLDTTRKNFRLESLWNEDTMDTPTPPEAITDLPETSEDTATADVLGAVGDVTIDVTVQAGSVTLPIHELATLTPGKIVRLDRADDAPVDILANGRKIATAEATVIQGQYAVRILTVG